MEVVAQASTLNYVLSIIQVWGPLVISISSLLVAVVSLVKSLEAQKMQIKVSELELKIKESEIEKIQREKEEASLSCVEARAICLGGDNYRLKVWNSGKASAFNIVAKFEGDPQIIIMDDEKMPFEELEPRKNFELILITHMGSSRKFRIITEWDDENGQHHKKTQMGDI